jgi:hypothetical protein
MLKPPNVLGIGATTSIAEVKVYGILFVAELTSSELKLSTMSPPRRGTPSSRQSI